ncbi:type IV pilus biogenesis/stability protein PilW [Erwinia sp.]|uniref:type IV pilus biogenesis/stability protein PilW n=1 Tax=Erwinia citreus TaxID=558 RepID=UPI00289C2115|nr:type IV pilus biogenesis/stability protein PilW [Erwinia sp.]
MNKGLLIGLVALLLAGCSVTAPHSELAGTRLQLGLAWLAQDRLAPAERNLRQALKLAPDDYRCRLAMARYYQRVGDNASALAHYRKALEQAEQNRDVINNYGAFLCLLGQYDAAQQQFSKAMHGPGRVDALENAGYCYLRADEGQKAKAALLEATRNDAEKRAALLAEAERRFGKNERDSSRLLLDVYQHNFAASAQSLWLEIRFAARAGQPESIRLAGEQLARNFPQSIQYLHFLANEY